MSSRRSLRSPILLAVGMLSLLIVLTVGWVLLSVFGALSADRMATLYWALLPIGSVFTALLSAGVVLYLILSVKAINLTRQQSNFIDAVTHELKSPLASMKLALQTLSRHHVAPEQQAEFFRFVLDDVERLDRLINQVLAAGRLESERVDGEAKDVDLPLLLKQCAVGVCESYRLPVETVRFDCEPCLVHARPVDLDLVFRNLLDNAVKYGGNPPLVEVCLRRKPGDRVATTIADNGHGIPRPLRAKIFGRFVRLGQELERERPGTGLGLYIVRTIVRRLRGQVTVHDRVCQPGSVFEVVLPALPHVSGV
jgi:signal transduction histidine kinase